MKKSIIALLTLLVFTLYYLLIMKIIPSPIKYSTQNVSFLLSISNAAYPWRACYISFIKKDGWELSG